MISVDLSKTAHFGYFSPRQNPKQIFFPTKFFFWPKKFFLRFFLRLNVVSDWIFMDFVSDYILELYFVCNHFIVWEVALCVPWSVGQTVCPSVYFTIETNGISLTEWSNLNEPLKSPVTGMAPGWSVFNFKILRDNSLVRQTTEHVCSEMMRSPLAKRAEILKHPSKVLNPSLSHAVTA